MRWKVRPEPIEGDSRVIHKFLWLPRTLGGETRWLEFAWINQTYRKVTSPCFAPTGSTPLTVTSKQWVSMSFV